HTDEGQVTVLLAVIQAVSDYEPGRQLEADVLQGQVDQAVLRLVEQDTHFQAGRLARLQIPQEVIQRQPGIDHVFDTQNVPAADRNFQVFHQAHDSRRASVGGITGYGDEIDLDRDGDGPQQIGHEE